ncbi:unnamed protein product [Phytophthora fragariaefolia]|uniref:Unnamed protein product n=1 Tax=Phytophthora fragariaefolia TaxID=1490495 RepID=A0A9W6Y1G2_9STRA|nr:unnamed protein product [Phytophthora fragariaefolia]
MANVIFAVFGLVLLYWTICRELPDVAHVGNVLVKLNAQIEEVQRAADTCHAALMQWERAVAQELCMPVGIDGVLLLVNAWLLLHYYRRWARYLMVLMAVMFVVDVPGKLYEATFPAPEIHKVDPTFAMVDEELLVALDGKNLKPGGNIGWVAYWGCATTLSVDACEKQFASTFEAGNVAVTFKSLDHFIPCYRDPPNPLKAQEYQCFESVRIRVKDKQSIPGWSRSVSQTFSISRPTNAGFSQHDERNEHTLTIKESLSTQITGEAKKPVHMMARSTESIEPIENDGSSVGVSSDPRGEVDNVKGAQENNSFFRNDHGAEPVAAALSKVETGQVKEVEVTSEAHVKIRDADTEPEYFSHNDGTTRETLAKKKSEKQVQGVEGQSQRDEGVSVHTDPVEMVENRKQKLDELKTRPDVQTIDNSYIDRDAIPDEEFTPSTLAEVVQGTETDQPSQRDNQEEKLQIHEEDFKMLPEAKDYQQSPEATNYEPTSAISQKSEQDDQDSKQEPRTRKAAETPSKPFSSTAQSEGIDSKKKSSTKRKGRRSRSGKMSLQADVEIVG